MVKHVCPASCKATTHPSIDFLIYEMKEERIRQTDLAAATQHAACTGKEPGHFAPIPQCLRYESPIALESQVHPLCSLGLPPCAWCPPHSPLFHGLSTAVR